MNPIIKWINMLRGKKTSEQEAVKSKNVAGKGISEVDSASQSETQQEKGSDFYFEGQATDEDSVIKDVKTAEKFAKQVFDKVKEAPIPKPKINTKDTSGPTPRKQTLPSMPDSVSKKLSNELLGKIIRIVVIIVMIVILVFVLFSIFRMLDGNGGGIIRNNPTPAISNVPSPTPVEYRPFEPSVYADDPEVLQIEEDASILDAEIFRTRIGDPVIRPPTLDFNVSF